MSGIGFWEFFFLCVIGLVVLGPKRLPQVASQIGSWVGQARRMTRVMRRQLEDELDFRKELDIKPLIDPPSYKPPSDDDTYSPLHTRPPKTVAGIETGAAPDPVEPRDSASEQVEPEQVAADDSEDGHKDVRADNDEDEDESGTGDERRSEA